MSKSLFTRTALALALAAALAACGGGETPRSAAQSFTDALASTPAPSRSDRLRALATGVVAAATTTTITNEQFFQGAEAIYPDLFPTTPAPTSISNLPYQGRTFVVKAYANGNFLGVSNDGIAWGLGPFTGGELVQFGTVQSFAALVCGTITCSTGGTGGGTGALNGCVEPASTWLRVGNTYEAVYANQVFAPVASSGEYRIDGEVDSTTTFEGQAAFKVRNRVRGQQSGEAVDADVFSFSQVGDNDLTLTYGSETQVSVSGFSLNSRTVFNPAELNSEFTLQIGQSLDKTTSSTTTMTGGPIPFPPTSGSSTTQYTYEARETITVQGRSWETCRYREAVQAAQHIGYSWYIVGRGFTARHESRNASGTVLERSELKSAKVNGAAI